MGLIRNADEQGKQATENIAKSLKKSQNVDYDLIIIGAGPAGISACLTAKKHGLRFLLLEQDTLGGTVFTFPRKKIVMTSPMDLPLFGKVKLFETNKTELLELWQSALSRNNITIQENSKVESINSGEGKFNVQTLKGEIYTAESVLLAIGRRGSPRKLNIPGEMKEKVAYRLLEPELISGKDIMVVGGGDSAVESALLLADLNNVTVSYRGENFNRLKQANNDALSKAIDGGKLSIKLNSNLTAIDEDTVSVSFTNGIESVQIKNSQGESYQLNFSKKPEYQSLRNLGKQSLKGEV
jgi:thioredoxin reductase